MNPVPKPDLSFPIGTRTGSGPNKIVPSRHRNCFLETGSDLDLIWFRLITVLFATLFPMVEASFFHLCGEDQDGGTGNKKNMENKN